MTKAGSTGGPAGLRAEKQQERAERLAAALRDNLRRRKAQARERAAEAGQPGQQEPGQEEPTNMCNPEPAGNAVNKTPPDQGS